MSALRHVQRCRMGYAAGVFMAVAAVTCGVLQGKEYALPVHPLFFTAACAILEETLFSLGILLASARPFGCVLSAVILMTKGYRIGFTAGRWLNASYLGLFRLIPVSLLGMTSLTALLVGCCTAAYAALKPGIRRESMRWIAAIWFVLVICAVLRCLIGAGMT